MGDTEFSSRKLLTEHDHLVDACAERWALNVERWTLNLQDVSNIHVAAELQIMFISPNDRKQLTWWRNFFVVLLFLHYDSSSATHVPGRFNMESDEGDDMR